VVIVLATKLMMWSKHHVLLALPGKSSNVFSILSIIVAFTEALSQVTPSNWNLVSNAGFLSMNMLTADLVFYPKFACQCNAGMGMCDLNEIEQDAQWFALHSKMHSDCHESAVVRGRPTVSGKVQLPIVFLQ
jgi:hypothetical protein